MSQLDLFDQPKPKPHFNGADYDHERDQARLSGQIERVYNYMRDGQWRSLDDISQATGDPPASVSAQLRHLRKARFGGHAVNKQHVGNGLYIYQLIVKGEAT